MGEPVRRKALISSVTLLCLFAVGSTPAASLASPVAADRVSARVPQFDAVVNGYLRTYPTLTREQALRSALGQEHRIRLLERLQSQDPTGFGGSWYDPLTDTQHINTVGAAAATRAGKLGADAGLTIAAHQVTYSLTQLQVIAADINAGKHPVFGRAAIDTAAPDAVANKVTVTLPAADLARFENTRSTLSSVIVLKEGDARSSTPECASRLACTTPLRSGIVLWHGPNRTGICSLGFTARAGDGSRWAVTAGHCGTESGEFAQWGHSAEPIGLIQAGRDSGNIDIARIQVSNPVWQTGGYLYDFWRPNVPAPLHYSITARGTIQAGDVVCLSAWHSGVENCGGIRTAFGARGMPEVYFDACPGDSGGGWFYITSYGENWAYGIHRGQPSGSLTCHRHDLNTSIFTAVPDMNAWWDSTTAALLRLEER
ncbi:protease [Phytohabitans aurantiacus]|uniref:Protease n=1 Tax=Phytohabitans aurantiacus TaxID=3016789 RepID=A0ABQ5R6Y1_9ACTN|nr:protease [Phytohabitans aurantiacus]